MNLAQVTEWYNSTPREYKIRILAPEKDEMQCKIIPELDITWLDLDHRKVQFRSDHRPRARYLNYMYLVAMLRRSWDHKLTKPADVLKGRAR